MTGAPLGQRPTSNAPSRSGVIVTKPVFCVNSADFAVRNCQNPTTFCLSRRTTRKDPLRAHDGLGFLRFRCLLLLVPKLFDDHVLLPDGRTIHLDQRWH